MTMIDLNCDMGEGFGAYTIGDDAEMLRIVSSANIACGFHAGDPNVMDATLRLAAQNGVGAGAHPGFLDLYGFGRRQIRGDSPAEIERQIIYQIGALQALAHAAGIKLSHVKSHGALGNMAAEEADLAMALARAIKAVDRDLIFVVMPGMETERAGEQLGLPMAREVYCDRAYADNGNLLSRKLPGAVIHDAEAAADRVIRMVESQSIVTISGERREVRIDSICVHSDTKGALAMAQHLCARLQAAGLAVVPMAKVIGLSS
jgi:UPF0271 protein